DYVCHNEIIEDIPTVICIWTYLGDDCYTSCDPDPDPEDPDPDPEDPPEPEYYDCAGVLNGSAYTACCGCIGGTTGITECPNDQDNPNTEPTVSLIKVPYTGGFPPG